MWTRRSGCAALALLCIAFPAIGQRHSLSGKITVAGEADVFQAFILVKSEDMSRTLAYTSPDSEGYYSLTFYTDEDYVHISVRGLGLKMVTERVPSSVGNLDLTVETEAYSLKEVTIKSEKIVQKNDTVKYNIAAFRTPEDRVVEDVIRKLPGITVQDGGRILYMGKPVSLTIDGQDLLKGKYSIATRNISPDHISTVEILENHQVIKALQGLVPGNITTLNLKLKASSRGILLVSSGLGAGYGEDWLRDLESAGMWFGHKSQHIVTAKHNNSGTDLSYELSDQEKAREHRTSYSQALLASPPDLSKSRYYFNNSYATTANNLWKTPRGDRMVANAGYIKSDDVRDGLSESAFLLPDSTRNVITETISNAIKQGRVYTDLSYTHNRERNYVRADIIVKADVVGVESFVNSLHQHSSDKDISVDAEMTLIRRTTEKTGYELTMAAHYNTCFQNLEADISENTVMQKLFQDHFAARGAFSGFKVLSIRGFTFSPLLRFALTSDRLKSSLEGWTDESNPLSNDLKFFTLGLTPSINASYLTARFSLEMSLPMPLRFLSLSGRTPLESCRLDLVPSVSLKYKLSALWDARIGYSKTIDERSLETLFDGVIMRNYRTFSYYNPTLTISRSHNFNAGLKHHNIFKMLFAGVSTSCTIGCPDILFGSNYDGIFAETISIRTKSLIKVYRWSVDAGKGFYWKNTNLKSQVDYVRSDVPYLNQAKEGRTKSGCLRLSASLSMEPFNFINLTYSMDMMRTRTEQLSGESFEPLFTISNVLSATFRIPSGFSITLAGDNYINSRTSGDRSFSLMDAALDYTVRKMKITLSCRNLLDVKKYIYSNISGAASFSSTYLVRPREVSLKIQLVL